ncbi:MAG: sulfotransferase family protein [Rhodobacteraceae bacterium]|nr:sulfotransferase family protein [Paracoccaceae bacterium]
MLYFQAQNLAFLETPKTGSTAICKALRPYASISYSRPPKLRHMRALAFKTHTEPYLKHLSGQDVSTFAVMRHPVDRLVSWYRYRLGRPHTPAGDKIQGMSFDEFASAVINQDERASDIGRQDNFLCDKNGNLLVDYVFQYDRQDLLQTFLEAWFREPITLSRENTSRGAPVETTPAARQVIETGRAGEMALWQQLTKDGVLGLDE